jgi:hypothetical protein
MGRNAGDRLTPEVAREICQRVDAYAMLTGSIAALGSQDVIGLKAVDCNTGNVLAEAQAPSKERVLKALHVRGLQQPQRNRAGGGECAQGLRAAREGKRARAAQHRGILLLVCDRIVTRLVQ